MDENEFVCRQCDFHTPVIRRAWEHVEEFPHIVVRTDEDSTTTISRVTEKD